MPTTGLIEGGHVMNKACGKSRLLLSRHGILLSVKVALSLICILSVVRLGGSPLRKSAALFGFGH